MNFQTLNRQRKYILIAAAAGAIAVFLPWATISVDLFGYSASQSINGFHSYGIVVILGFMVTMIIAFTGELTKPLEKKIWMASLCTGVLSLLFNIISVTNVSSSFGNGFDFADINIGFGAWIALVASTGIVMFTSLFRNSAGDLKNSFHMLRKNFSETTDLRQQNSNRIYSETIDKIDELERLSKLKDAGSLSEDEYQQLKSRVL